MRRLLVGTSAWGTAIAVAVSLIGLAACGGQVPGPSASEGGLPTSALSTGIASTPRASGSAVKPTPAPTATPAAPSFGGGTPLPSLPPEVLAAIPDLSPVTGQPLPKPVRQVAIGTADLLAAIQADAVWQGQLDLAKQRGFTGVDSGVATTYDDGSVAVAVVLTRAADRAILMRTVGSRSSVSLIRPIIAGGRIAAWEITTPGAIVTVDTAGKVLTRQDLHHSCSEADCIAGVEAMYAADPNYLDSLYIATMMCLGGNLVACATAGVLFGVEEVDRGRCQADPCTYCASDECGPRYEPTGRYCDSATLYGTPSLVERYLDYFCERPGTYASHCNSTEGTQLITRCSAGCAPAPAGGESPGCACTRNADCPGVSGYSQCAEQQDGTYRVTQSRIDHCQDGLCVPGETLDIVAVCPLGCDRSLVDEGCFDPGNCTGVRPLGVATGSDESYCRYDEASNTYTACRWWAVEHAVTTSDGGYCAEEAELSCRPCTNGCEDYTCLDPCTPGSCQTDLLPHGEPICLVDDDGQSWLRNPATGGMCVPTGAGGSACSVSRSEAIVAYCPLGCAPPREQTYWEFLTGRQPPSIACKDNVQCVGAHGSDVLSCAPPAAPSEFEVTQRPEGTKFWWVDNATNETGFHIYFGSRSKGEPWELLKDVNQANAVGAIIPWKRTGGATCWELYAYNAAGESLPATYCLPG